MTQWLCPWVMAQTTRQEGRSEGQWVTTDRFRPGFPSR
jgi:hypothetical protein